MCRDDFVSRAIGDWRKRVLLRDGDVRPSVAGFQGAGISHISGAWPIEITRLLPDDERQLVRAARDTDADAASSLDVA